MSQIYQIRIRGQLGSEWSEWFAGLQVIADSTGATLLVGELDQTSLHGVLARVRDLNLNLLSVNRMEADRKTRDDETRVDEARSTQEEHQNDNNT